MKYFIITKKHINILKIFLSLIIAIIIIYCMFLYFYPKTVQTFSPQDILENQLPKEGKKSKFSDFTEKILGFSPDNPISIIDDFSSAFEGYEIIPETQEPEISESKKEEVPKASEVPEIQKYNVQEKTIKNSHQIKNETSFEVSLSEFENEKLNLSGVPTVLIVHTHTTESYAPEDENMYFINDNSRSCDNTKNMIAVGEVISERLKERNINVIHDTTFHDYPVYNGAYGRSLATIKNQLKNNEGINVILDIHRDAVISADGTRTKVISDIGGRKAAQIMFVVGTNGSGLSHSGWRDNLTFAAKIQKEAEEKYPGLMRPLNLREERFNQHMTPCSIIIEVGTNANTLKEAKTGAELIGECIADVLNS